MLVIDCNGLYLLIFEEKWPNYASGPKPAPNSDRNVVPFFAILCGLETSRGENYVNVYDAENLLQLLMPFDLSRFDPSNLIAA